MMNKTFLTEIFLLFIAFVSNCHQNVSEGNKAKLITVTDSILQSQVVNDKIPGAVLLIKQFGKVIYRRAYGYAQKYDFNHNLLKPPEKMTIDHLFDIASLTKVIGTTTSIMLLTDRGLINIEDPVSKYLKAFDTPVKKTITIRNLLTHTAGLYEWYPLYYLASDKYACY